MFLHDNRLGWGLTSRGAPATQHCPASVSTFGAGSGYGGRHELGRENFISDGSGGCEPHYVASRYLKWRKGGRDTTTQRTRLDPGELDSLDDDRRLK
jgi:hypothetical protein